MICARCDGDLDGQPVTVVRKVIVARAVRDVRVCVPCDSAVNPADLYWYERKQDHVT